MIHSRNSVDFFCESPAEDFLCSICTDVFDEPLLLPCRHTFCGVCIRATIERSADGEPTECPLCRELFEETDLRQPPINFQSLLNNLRMRCKNVECGAELNLEDFWTHNASCDFGSVGCPFASCGDKFFRKDLEHHRTECEYRDVPCRECCGEIIQYRDFNHHFYNDCRLGKRICGRCCGEYSYAERDQHDCVKYLQGKIQTLEEQKLLMSDQMKTTSDDLKTKDGQIKTLADDLKKNDGQIKTMSDDLKRKDREIKTMSDDLKRKDDRIKAMSDEIKTISDQLKTITTCIKPGNACTTRPPRSARLKTSFGAKIDDDQQAANSRDILLLPGNFILFTDINNKCLKLFNEKCFLQGEFIFKMQTEAGMYKLAHLGNDKVALLNTETKTLEVLKVSHTGIINEKTANVEKVYYSLCALDTQTIVAVLLTQGDTNMDILTLDGQVLRSLATSSFVNFVSLGSFGSLMCTCHYENSTSVLKVNATSGLETLKKSVAGAGELFGIATTRDNSHIVCGRYKKILYLLDTDGNKIQDLWSVPAGDESGTFDYISLLDDVVVCCTRSKVFVLELLY